jgi:beta-lactamase class A
MDAVNATMRELGLKESILGRPMRGRPANPDEQENLATPSEFAHLIGTILDGTAASAESCMGMLEMLKLQSNDKRIGRFVPEGMVWGSKTGSYTTVVNDVGFVMTKDGPLIVSVFAEDVADVVTGEVIISAITRALLN